MVSEFMQNTKQYVNVRHLMNGKQPEQKVRKEKMDNIEKLLLIVLFIAILYYPLCAIVGFIEFVRQKIPRG